MLRQRQEDLWHCCQFGRRSQSSDGKRSLTAWLTFECDWGCKRDLVLCEGGGCILSIVSPCGINVRAVSVHEESNANKSSAPSLAGYEPAVTQALCMCLFLIAFFAANLRLFRRVLDLCRYNTGHCVPATRGWLAIYGNPLQNCPAIFDSADKVGSLHGHMGWLQTWGWRWMVRLKSEAGEGLVNENMSSHEKQLHDKKRDWKLCGKKK